MAIDQVGDRRRHDLFARFLAAQYPWARSVADVAGGKGYLSLALYERGYRPRLYDTRRRFARTRRPWPRFVRPFGLEDAKSVDLVVGLHPDSATETIARVAAIRPVAVVPCCSYWNGLESHGSPDMPETIRRCWRKMGVRWRETTLPMNGKNLVLWVEKKS